MIRLTHEAQVYLDDYLADVRSAVAGHSSVSPAEIEQDVRDHVFAALAGGPGRAVVARGAGRGGGGGGGGAAGGPLVLYGPAAAERVRRPLPGSGRVGDRAGVRTVAGDAAGAEGGGRRYHARVAER